MLGLIHQPGNDRVSQWQPRLYADVHALSFDDVARSLAMTRRQISVGLAAGIIVGMFANTTRSARRKRHTHHCEKGKKRCPDGHCYLKDKACCPKKHGGGACRGDYPVCCPSKKGHQGPVGCVKDKASCDVCGPGSLFCPPNASHPYYVCVEPGGVCCPDSTSCPAEAPVCCPPDTQRPFGYCLQVGNECFV